MSLPFSRTREEFDELRDRAGATTSINVRMVPRELRNKFKSICARDGISMQDRLLQLIADDVESFGAESYRGY